MVIIKERKKADIFEGFHLDDDHVRSNAQQLEEDELKDLNTSSMFVDEDVFADFNLDEIVKQNEKRRQQQRQKVDDDDDVDDDDGNDDDDDLQMEKEDGSTTKITTRKRYRQHRWSKNTSTISTLAEEGNDRQSISTIAEEGQSVIGETAGVAIVYNPGSTRGINYANNNSDDNGNDNGNNADDNQTSFDWTSPHLSDSIFSNFDLDTIAKSYEKKLLRKAAARDQNVDMDDNDNILFDFDRYDYEGKNNNQHKNKTTNNNVITLLWNDIKIRCQKWGKHWWLNFPRTHGILIRIIIPLLMLVGVTILLGIYLAKFECQNEYDDNDAVMRATYQLQNFPFNKTLTYIQSIPIICFNYYLHAANITTTPNNSTSTSTRPMDTFIENDILAVQEFTGNEFPFPPIPPPPTANSTTTIEETINNIQDYVLICKTQGYDLTRKIINSLASISSKLQTSDGSSSSWGGESLQIDMNSNVIASIPTMSFSWIRCWNQTEYGNVNPGYATRRQLAAAGNQTSFYREMWLINQKELYNQYLQNPIASTESNIHNNNTNTTSCIDLIQESYNSSLFSLPCRKNAHDKSVIDATGSKMCDINIGSSSWFWFSVMTTVGWGNFAPVTTKGMLLVGLLGWLLIIIYALILFNAGKVLSIIIDDLFHRCTCGNRTWWTGDVQRVIIWGSLAILCGAFIGGTYFVADNYTIDPYTWNVNIPDDADAVTIADSYWFAYISLLTVGLGDFFLEPEFYLYTELLYYEFAFLFGFTFLSTFLGAINVLIRSYSHWVPDSGNSLKERLMDTELVTKKDIQYKERNERGIKKLERLVELMDDDNVEVTTQRVTRIRVKKYLLVHLLYQTKHELEYYDTKHNTNDVGDDDDERLSSLENINLSYDKICQQEMVLHAILANTELEREKHETYRNISTRTTRTNDVNGGSSATNNELFLADGTTVDDLNKKLNLTEQKSKFKSLSASDYI